VFGRALHSFGPLFNDIDKKQQGVKGGRFVAVRTSVSLERKAYAEASIGGYGGDQKGGLEEENAKRKNNEVSKKGHNYSTLASDERDFEKRSMGG